MKEKLFYFDDSIRFFPSCDVHRICDQLQDYRRYARRAIRPNVEPEVGMQHRHAAKREKLQRHCQAAN